MEGAFQKVRKQERYEIRTITEEYPNGELQLKQMFMEVHLMHHLFTL
jgi:hypothetical protein